MDTFTRFSPVIDPRFTYRSENVVEAPDRAYGRLGYPKAIRVDQGTEFVSRNLDLWAYAHGVTLGFSRPGKPTDNAFTEAFNGRFRAECLNGEAIFGEIDNRGNSLFFTLTYPQDASEALWVDDANGQRFDLSPDVVFVALKNGMHDGRGFIFYCENVAKFALPDDAHVAGISKVVLNYFEQPNADQMD